MQKKKGNLGRVYETYLTKEHWASTTDAVHDPIQIPSNLGVKETLPSHCRESELKDYTKIFFAKCFTVIAP